MNAAWNPWRQAERAADDRIKLATTRHESETHSEEKEIVQHQGRMGGARKLVHKRTSTSNFIMVRLQLLQESRVEGIQTYQARVLPTAHAEKYKSRSPTEIFNFDCAY